MLRLLVAVAPARIPHLGDVSLDGRVLAMALGVSMVCGLLFGLAPALRVPRSEALRRAPAIGTAVSIALGYGGRANSVRRMG